MTTYRVAFVESGSNTIIYMDLTESNADAVGVFDKELDPAYILQTKAVFSEAKYILVRLDRKEATTDWETVKQKIIYL